MLNVLTGCQAQQMLINVSKNNTIHLLLQKQFPAIKSSDNKPTYYVTPKTHDILRGDSVDVRRRRTPQAQALQTHDDC